MNYYSSYKKLQNLTTSGAYLLQSNKITLKSAVKLAKYSKEIQMKFINHVGLENINDLKISVFSPKEEPKESELEAHLNLAKEAKVPYLTKVNISVPTKFA